VGRVGRRGDQAHEERPLAPLKAAELHRLAREELGPTLAGIGFRRTPRATAASWLRAEGDRWLILWFQPSQTNYVGQPGFKFTVEFELAVEPTYGGNGRRARLAALLTDAERERLRALENRVIASLPPPDPHIARRLDKRTRESWLRGWRFIDKPYGPHDDVWFRQAGEADARELLALIRVALPGAIDRFLVRAGA